LFWDWGSGWRCCAYSGGGEKAKCFSERNSEKEETWHQRRNGDGNPDLLSPFLDCLDKFSVNLCAYGSRFLSYEMAEIAGIAIQGKDANKSPDSRHVSSGRPFTKCGVLVDSMLNARHHPLEVLCNGAVRTFGESLKGSAE
jgi:hypothetical protein